MARRALRWTVLTVTLALAAAGAWLGLRPEPVAVQLAEVERGHVEELVANTRAGSVEACRRARLSPGQGGQIARLAVEEGERVEAGDILLELWNDDLIAQRALALSQAESAEARAEAACVKAENARREADRLTRLQESGAISEERVDKAVSGARAQEADCQAAVASANVSAAQVGVARANLERTRLKAPFAGVIAEINGEVHEYLTPSPPGIPTPPAIDLIGTGCFYVSAPIDEVDVPAVRTGMAARITMDAFRDQSFAGRVRRIADFVLELERQARTVGVEVEFTQDGIGERLLAGYSADVEIVVAARQDTLRIPTRAIIEGDRVFVYEPSTGTLGRRGIETGLSNWDYTEIRKGLQSGQRIVLSVDRAGVADGAPATPATPDD